VTDIYLDGRRPSRGMPASSATGLPRHAAIQFLMWCGRQVGIVLTSEAAVANRSFMV
jgi:hypothetical protein